jgi:hypothetical protein
MKSLELEAKEYCVNDSWTKDESPQDREERTFLAGASAALRLLSEKDGREFWIKECEHHDEIRNFTDEIDNNQYRSEGYIHVTEAAPIRARIALLEEKLALGGNHTFADAQYFKELKSENAALKAQLAEGLKIAEEMNEGRAQDHAELATLRAQLEGFKTARIMAGPEDVKEYIHNHEVAHSELQKKGQGDETV